MNVDLMPRLLSGLPWTCPCVVERPSLCVGLFGIGTGLEDRPPDQFILDRP